MSTSLITQNQREEPLKEYCMVRVEKDMMQTMKRLAAAKRFESVSEMVRIVMKRYMDQEISKVK